MSKQVNQAVRTVKTRDTATSILRKLAVKPHDYNLFITKVDGGFSVNVLEAQAHLQALTKPAVNQVVKDKLQARFAKSAEFAKASKAKTRARSCSSAARELILGGKTNAEVWEALAAEFNLNAKKRGYPAWYRFQLRKAGHAV